MLRLYKICLQSKPTTRQINIDFLLKEESDKEVNHSGYQSKHAESDLNHQPEVELLKLNDFTPPKGFFCQLNQVLKGVNHGNHHEALDHCE